METWRRGETFFSASPRLRVSVSHQGFSLIELVITITVLAILTLGTVPLAQVTVKRQKEQELREALRQMREAIDQFHREALAGAQMQANQQQGQTTTTPNQPNPNQQNQPPNIFGDPRVRVAITDQTIFTADNIDRYPPDLGHARQGRQRAAVDRRRTEWARQCECHRASGNH